MVDRLVKQAPHQRHVGGFGVSVSSMVDRLVKLVNDKGEITLLDWFQCPQWWTVW